MPVSVVCESSSNVTAALRESLGVGSCATADEAKTGSTPKESHQVLGKIGRSDTWINEISSAMTGNGSGSSGHIDDDIVAATKRVLLDKIEYEEVTSYSKSVLDQLKSKYILLKPDATDDINNGRSNNGSSTSANGSSSGKHSNGVNGHYNTNENGSGNSGSSAAGSSNGNNGTSASNIKHQQQQQQQQGKQNPNELPQPKRVLYPRDNVRIGWKNSQRKWQVGVGMMNVGNTCYLNSTLQALFHVPAMANWLMSDTVHMERCDAPDAGCIICAMAKTLQASQTHQSAIRPYMVYSKLKSICKHMVMGRQEDAHEFLRYLIDSMEKSYLSRFRNFKDLDQYSKETTPLNQILGGYLKSAVRCLACSHISVTFQHFEDLLLDIRKADTIEEALEGYFARERLEDMGYKCEACKKKVSATKQFSLERAPIALCIQLKRFSMLGTKLNKQITIKSRLDLTKFASRKTAGEQLTYRLVSMVTHLGASQHCGHYTAIGLTDSGSYYNYDDSYVRPISVQSVCNTNAYIIFYELDNSSSPSLRTQTITSGLQFNNSTATKENGLRISNGSLNNSMASPQRMIGPQLPPAGLASYTSTTPTSPLAVANANKSNGISTSPYAASTSKLSINRQHPIPTSSNVSASITGNGSNNNKITIHFKNTHNGHNVLKSNANSSVSTATATATSTQSQNTKAGNSPSKLHNGLFTGTGKFQESAYAKPTLAGSSNKGQTASVSNGNESSFSDDDDVGIDGDGNGNDNDEHEVSSSTQNERKLTASSSTSTAASSSTLPSMPRLFGHNGVLANGVGGASAAAGGCGSASVANGSSSNNNKKLTSSSPMSSSSSLSNHIQHNTSFNNASSVKNQLKSLVPYESASDDEDASCSTSYTTTNATDYNMSKRAAVPLKRHERMSSPSLSSDNSDDDNNACSTNFIKCHSNGQQKTIKKPANSNMSNNFSYFSNRITTSPSPSVSASASASAAASSSSSVSVSKVNKNKQKTDAIDDIFKSIKKSTTTTTSSSVSTPTKKSHYHHQQQQQQPQREKSQSHQLLVSSTTDMDSDIEQQPEQLQRNAASCSWRQFKRAQSTPPSPPVVKTKIGLWQVTTLQPPPPQQETTVTSSPTVVDGPSGSATRQAKNLKNPFARKVPDLIAAKRPKLNTTNSNNKTEKRNGNGYQQDDASESAISELLKQSHRGYGASVLTWNGNQTEIEKEIIAESREQRQREWEDEEENEIDRGRQRKTKVSKESNTHTGASLRTPGYNPFQEHDNQRRWHKGGGGGGYRFAHSGHFRHQFQRNKFKFQRYNNKFQHRTLHQQRNGGVNGSGFNRRQDS